MSAAAARHRKQLAARKASGEQDVVGSQLEKLLNQEQAMDEASAYEALQLAQSQARKLVFSGDYTEGCDLCYKSAAALLAKGRVSVASQLLQQLVDLLRETHTEETDTWIQRLVELDVAHDKAMKDVPNGVESIRLRRLQREWLRLCLMWSSDLGKVRFGNNALHERLALQHWMLSGMMETDEEGKDKNNQAVLDDEEDDVMEAQADAVIHMALAEKPDAIVDWLATLPAPTAAETATGHECPPAVRDALLTRALLCLCAVENLRDANTLLRGFIEKVESRDMTELQASYTNKEDGKAPSHVIFGCMLLRICEKDARTGPLYSWLLRSFKRELEGLYKAQVPLSYTTKIGKIYFNIQPPPSMLNMVENMMGMMGGGGGGAGGMNPAMMQALAAQMQQGM